MKKFNLFFATALMAAISTTAFAAGTVTYRMSIDGNFATSQPFLTAGTHTLVVQASVTNNELAPGVQGGLFQSAFNLNTNNAGFNFVDVTGGFIGAPNAAWDSTDFIPPFDTHNKGVTTLTDGGGPNNGGGPFVVAETSGIAPGNFNAKFGDVGANVFTTVATGNFSWGGSNHPTALNLVVANPLGGDIVVAALSGGNVVGASPTEVFNATINFIDGDPNGDPNDPVENTPPSVDDLFTVPDPNDFVDTFDQQTLATFTNPASYQLQGTDTETPEANLLWTLNSFTGPFQQDGVTPMPGSGNGNQALSSSGLFTWNPLGSNRGYYYANVSVTDTGNPALFSTGVLRVQVPEPAAFVLAGLSLVGIVAGRRRAA